MHSISRLAIGIVSLVLVEITLSWGEPPNNDVSDVRGNTASGSGALSHLTTGSDNTAVGSDALWSVTTGFANTAVGSDALLSTTTGTYNTAVGFYTLYANTT